MRIKRSDHLARFALLLALAAATAGVGRAQQVFPSTPPTSVPDVDVDVQEGKLMLSLEDALGISLRRNLGLRVQRFRREQAWQGIARNLGAFDLGLTLDNGYFSESQPAASQLSGADVTQVDGANSNVRLDQLVATGGQFSLVWNNSYQKTNSIFSSVNPSYTINFDLVYAQPLLANYGKNATKRNLLISRNDSEISFETLVQAIITDVDQVESAYWSLVEAQAQLEVSQQGLQLAKDLHEMNRIQVEVGTMAPLELVQSEVGVATREEEVLRAEVLAQDSADLLRQLLNLDNSLWDLPIEPTTDARTERIDIDVEEAIRTALAERSEVRAQQLEIENLETDQHFFKNQKKPRLDAQVRYGYNALGGDVRIGGTPFDPRPLEILSGGYGDALKQIVQADFEGWAAGFVFAYPLQNRAAKANLAIADLALEEAQTRLDDLNLSIVTEVRRSARAVESAAKAIDLAEVSTRLAERNLDAERKRYENGLSTSFQVLEIQDDLTQARSREVSAIAAYRRALVLYYESIGRLLDEKGLEVQDDLAEK